MISIGEEYYAVVKCKYMQQFNLFVGDFLRNAVFVEFLAVAFSNVTITKFLTSPPCAAGISQ